jgi:tRNA-dihydrouridine synthase
MSKVPAHWDEIAKAVRLRDKMYPMNPRPSPSPKGRGKADGFRPLIIGNGDIKSYGEGIRRAKETGVDGIMVGRGAVDNPWVFNPQYFNGPEKIVRHSLGEGGSGGDQISIEQRFQALLQHLKLFEKFHKGAKPMVMMNKHIKAYVSGFANAGKLRAKLMQAKDRREAKSFVDDFLKRT